ncbi:oligosaccharide repeat unit polymerase family protein [Bacillus sp. FJAT-29790]|uniref:oligosaccharide repeat unit polymerase n=1 Tax=Bacillus sp. FJAT-29790 TaxID=1895002 RepID=UPI001C21BD07|nr:oligosaccharide repeat unit polymerase [Bacillus sp. FJAT-29790]MBU8881103.1 oligosaccharide repeat unit polymerase family protein [Bacillus sp. FJAT-29790]
MKKIIQQMNRIDTFSPYFFIPFILVLYFFTSLFDFSRFEYFEVRKNVLPPLLVGLASYFAAVYVTEKKKWTFPSFGLSFLKGKILWLLYILGFIGLVAYLIMLFTGQIGITDESVRRNLDPKLNFLSALLWFAVIFLICNRVVKEKELTNKKKFVYGAILATVFALFILMGYRTPIAIMFFTSLIVYHYIIKRIKLTWFLSFLFIVGLLFSLFGFYRIVSEDTTKEFNSRLGPDVERMEEDIDRDRMIQRKMNATPKWVRALNSESVTGHIVLSKLMEYTDKEGFLYGKLNFGTFEAVLPGKHISPRSQITEMVNSLSIEEGKYITRPGRTTTPTYLGQLYVDGGYIAIVIGFALYGFVIAMLYNQMRATGIKSYQTIGYAFVTTIFMICLHTGLLDLIFILMIGYAILSASIEQSRKQAS